MKSFPTRITMINKLCLLLDTKCSVMEVKFNHYTSVHKLL